MPKKKKPNKTELILSLPKTLTASQVVEEAKKRGVKLSSQLVYTVRQRQASGAPKKGPGRPRKAASVKAVPRKRGRPSKPSTGKVRPLTKQEMMFVDGLLSIGFERANEIMGMFAKI